MASMGQGFSGGADTAGQGAKMMRGKGGFVYFVTFLVCTRTYFSLSPFSVLFFVPFCGIAFSSRHSFEVRDFPVLVGQVRNPHGERFRQNTRTFPLSILLLLSLTFHLGEGAAFGKCLETWHPKKITNRSHKVGRSEWLMMDLIS